MSELFLSAPQAVGDYRAELGETPVWCSSSQSLLWVDILQHRLLRYWPAEQRTEQRQLDCLFSAVLLTDRPEQFLVVAQQGIGLYDYQLPQSAPRILCPWPADAAGTRPNEAAIAPDGSLWFSSMDLNEQQPIGGWYRFSAGDSQARKMLGGVTIPNTLAWYQHRVWFADSAEQKFYSAPAAAICADQMQQFDASQMTPDGSALSVDGDLLTARFGHSCLSHYQIGDDTLTLRQHLPLPVSQPSCCAFGGPQRNQLFITSARKELEHPTPLDGALLQVETGLTGAPVYAFRL